MINKSLGYYTCNGQEFASKLEACVYATKNKKTVDWHFNEDVFRKHDWTVEPDLSLDQLYDIRAREIREKYDYVILSYSGGADSNNILESFIRQQLHIDEVLVNTMTKANKLTVLDTSIKDSWNTGAEHELQTVPRLQYIKNACPRTKITVVDMSDYAFESLSSAGDASWISTKKEILNPGGVIRYNYMYFKDIKNQFDKSKSITIITGADKPRTTVHNGNFYFMLIDKALNGVSVHEHLGDYTNATVENFYWSPYSTKMLIKQSHVIKRWVEANPQYLPAWSFDDPDMYMKNSRLIHERVLRDVIYSTWNTNWFQVDKSTSDWYNEFDSWFYKSYKDTKEFSIWQEGLKHVVNNASDYIKYENGTQAFGLKAFVHKYNIGKMKI